MKSAMACVIASCAPHKYEHRRASLERPPPLPGTWLRAARWALRAGRWALGAGRWALGAGRCTAKSNSNWLYIKLLRQGPSQRHDGPIRQPSSRILTAFCSQAPPWEQRWLKLKYAHTWVSVCVGV